MGHRLVVLPDYQGLGIGTKFNDWCGEYMLSQGCKYYVKTAHYKLINYYKKNKYWEVIKEENRKFKKSDLQYKTSLPKGVDPMTYTKPFKLFDSKINKNNGKNMAHWINRPLISAKYLGKDYVEKEHKIILFEAELNSTLTEETLKEIINNDFYYEVICEGVRNGDITTSVCHKLGLQSKPLYYNNFKHVEDAIKSKNDIIYIYDTKHCQFLDKMKELNFQCIEKKNNTILRETSLFDL